MTIDTTKITPEKLAEMNDSLIVDNNHLRGRVKALTKERDDLLSAIENVEKMKGRHNTEIAWRRLAELAAGMQL